MTDLLSLKEVTGSLFLQACPQFSLQHHDLLHAQKTVFKNLTLISFFSSDQKRTSVSQLTALQISCVIILNGVPKLDFDMFSLAPGNSLPDITSTSNKLMSLEVFSF